MNKKQLNELTDRKGKECNYDVGNKEFSFLSKISYRHNDEEDSFKIILKESEEKRLARII